MGGAASISGNITTLGTFTSTNTGSNSFSGSLDITKGASVSNFFHLSKGFVSKEPVLFSVTIASTSVDFTSGGALEIPKNIRYARNITQFYCRVDGGTSKVINISDDGTNDTESITCDANGQIDTDVGTNDSFTAGEFWRLEMGATTGEVDYVTFEAYGNITSDD